MSKKVWFITGASKGLGLALTKLVLSQGDKVITLQGILMILKIPLHKIKIIFFH